MSSFKQVIEELKVPKEGKISDKTFTYNLIASILGIVLCLLFLSATTFAWYSSEISGGSMSISPSSCVIEVEIAYDSDPANAGAYDSCDVPSATVDSNDIVYDYNFLGGKIYKVTLKPTGTGTGYCKMKVGDSDKYYFSEQMSGGSDITFYITFEQDSAVEFHSCWGYYSGDVRDIKDSSVYTYTAGAELIKH